MESRAGTLEISAANLYEINDEWASVAYFYAAYHLARAAIQRDPIFDSLTLLGRKAPSLQQNDRDAHRHKGRVGEGTAGRMRDPGVTDIVATLYSQSISADYRKLFQYSLDVRYKSGIEWTDCERASETYARFRQAYDDGRLSTESEKP
jgi:hypothetical protein